MLSRLTYVLREMWASLTRNLTLTLAAIITSTVSLLLFGLTMLLQRAFDNQLERWTGGVEMLVYMENDSSAEQIEQVRGTLAAQTTLVSTVTYCDIPCALASADTLLAGSQDTRDKLNESNIPSYFEIVPVEADNTDLLLRMRDQFAVLPKVRSVEYPAAQIKVLEKLKGIIGVRTLAISVGLLLASVLLIWNTIRTAMFARRREIEVMKLVGATNWFIRIPFMLEGLLQGLIGGVLASGSVWFLNNNWTNAVGGFPFEAGLAAFVVTGVPWSTMALMLVVGAAVGTIGSATAASRFLDV